MPFDTSVFNIRNQVGAIDPVEAYQEGQAGRLQLADLARKDQLGDMQLAKAKQGFADEQKWRQVWTNAGGDLNRALEMAPAVGIGPGTLIPIRQSIGKMQGDIVKMNEQQQKLWKTKNDAWGSVAAGLAQIQDPAQREAEWQTTGRRALLGAGFTPAELPASLPADKAAQDQFLQTRANMAKTASQIFDEAIRTQQEARAAEAEKRAAAKAQTEQLQAGLDLAGRTAATIANQGGWTAWRSQLPAEVQGQIPAFYSPAAAEQVRRMGMTTAQQVTADAAAARDAQRALPKTPAELALWVNGPKRTPEEVKHGRAALADLVKQAQSTHITVGAPGSGADDPKLIAQAIFDGKQPPTLQGLYRLGGPVRAQLGRMGYDLTTAQRDWQAVQKHLATLNGPQQERLRQAISFTYDSLDVIEGLYNEWSKLANVSGMKVLNRATLAASKHLPGRMGEVATALESQINDLTSELGTVYKGGNSSTDETLRLAAGNLRAEWNDPTFRRGLGLIRKNLTIRKNSILNSEAVGVSEGSVYAPKPASGQPANAKDPLGLFSK